MTYEAGLTFALSMAAARNNLHPLHFSQTANFPLLKFQHYASFLADLVPDRQDIRGTGNAKT
jgi:hypothetical protein